jgi:hypothetical protein
MSKSKHTPGPWEWVGLGIDGPNHETVFRATDDERPFGMHSAVLEMNNEEYNKPLILAAPDLLEALEDVLECWKLGAAYDRRKEHDGAPARARAAIRKARGEQ